MPSRASHPFLLSEGRLSPRSAPHGKGPLNPDLDDRGHVLIGPAIPLSTGPCQPPGGTGQCLRPWGVVTTQRSCCPLGGEARDAASHHLMPSTASLQPGTTWPQASVVPDQRSHALVFLFSKHASHLWLVSACRIPPLLCSWG